MAVTTRPTRMSQAALIGLILGDQDSCGYAHSGLIRELCRHVKPTQVGELVALLYPGESIVDQPKAVRVALNEGMRLWQKEKK